MHGADPRRQAVLDEAQRWLGTPYHHMARVKGAGCDCCTFLAEVYARTGVVPHAEIPYYRADFMRHKDEETYLAGLAAVGREVAAPAPADVAIWKIGRVYSHSALVVDWPRIIHASADYGVIWGSATSGALARRPVKFFSPF